MTTDANSSYFPSMPPTFGWRRVVELADEFKVSTADMLAICDRLGVVAEDASEWLAPETVDLIRDVVAVGGPAALLKPSVPSAPPKPEKVHAEKVRAEKVPKPPKPPKPEKVRAEKLPKPPKPEKLRVEKLPKPPKPPKPEKVRAEKLPKPPKPEKVRAEKAPKPPKAEKSSAPAHLSDVPAVGSVSRDGVRTRRVVLIGLVVGVIALVTGVLVERWVDYVTSTDAPATVVTTEPR